MPSCVDLNIISSVCSVRYTPGRECGPVGFIFYAIGESEEDYLNRQTTHPLNTYTTYPKSVNYYITTQGTIYKLVDNDNVPLALNEIDDPSWPLLNTLCNTWSNVNELFIHIGFASDGYTITEVQATQAALLICCLAIELQIPVLNDRVIVGRDIDIKMTALWEVPATIVPKAEICFMNNGRDPYYLDGIGTWETRITELETWRENIVDPELIALRACCDTNTLAIEDLQTALTELQTEVDDINIDAINLKLSELEAGNLAIQQRLTIIENCLDCKHICEPEQLEYISYRLDLPIKLVPGVIQHINLPVKISDVDPPIVTTGPLWYASLIKDIQTLCTKVTITVFAITNQSTWCANSTLEAYVNVNGQNILIDTYVATPGSQMGLVSGSTTITLAADTTIWFGLKTNEDLYPLEINMASIDIKCADGLMKPNCSDCS